MTQVVKTRPKVSIWMRNVQLGLFSLPQAASLMIADAAIIADQGAFVGFSVLAWTVVLLKALGGLLVAAVVKCAHLLLNPIRLNLKSLTLTLPPCRPPQTPTTS